MIIRLAPDLVDEIKRAESQGGSARVRFGSVPANPTGNVIDVEGKEFKFTWSKEFGDLCDIYEEQQSGEDGNGLMVESGCAWRKVNVQRILDESTKNHVKMRSEEAERKMKSRKAIVLEPGNPSMKNQIRQLQAVETNPWMRKPFKQNKVPPFKKRKVEPPQVGSQPKSSFKPGLAATSSAKGRRSSSPLPPPPPTERSGTPASPFTVAGFAKSQLSTEEISVAQRKGKEIASTAEKENPTRANSAAQETPGRKWNPGAKSVELESMLITLLTENPKGMKLKDIEKAIDDTIPNPAKKIEPILKKIANVQAPGKYVLKSGMELESFKKPSSESESSPEGIHQHAPSPEKKHRHRHAPEPRVAERSPAKLEELSQLGSKLREENIASEKIDIEQQSSYIFGEKVDNSEQQVGSSSDSGTDSDSESDSSDSGSDSVSRSRSRSRSPAESGSGSSSDSESDVSSSGNEGSDEDVDIMTSDDDKEPQKQLQPSEQAISASLDPWRSIPNGTDDKQDGDESDAVDIEGHESDAVDIEKDFLDKKETEIDAKETIFPAEEGVDGAKSFPSAQARETFVGSLFDDNETFEKESNRHEQSDSSEMISKGKSKRGSDTKYGDGKSDCAKRPKAENFPHAPVSGGRDAQYLEDPSNRLSEDAYKGPENQIMNRADRERHSDFGSSKGNNQAFHGKSSSDFQQTERRPFDQNTRGRAPDTARRSKNAENMAHGHKFPEKVNNVHDKFPPQREKSSRAIHDEDNLVKEKKGSRNSKEGGPGGRHSASFDYDYRKQGEVFGFKDAAQVTNSHMVSPKDSNKADTDKHRGTSGRGLQRELSDLEMGELRDPLPEEKPVKKQFEKKGSFKQSENKPSTSDNYNPDITKGKYGGKSASDLGKPSPNIAAGLKQTPEHHNEATMKSRHKNVPSQPQHNARADAHEIGSQVGKLADENSRFKQNESGQKLGNGEESNKKAPITGQHFQDSKRGLISQSAVENKTRTPHTAADLTDGRMDTNLTKDGQRKRGSSSEDDSFSYSKFEKDVPDLKGPIKDLTQYKEYAMEYRDKYDAYFSLDKILENYRNEFFKMGKDLELAKNRDPDRYNKIVAQLRESYHQCGTKHRRLKKVFIILHKELKSIKQRMKDFAELHTIE